MLTTFEVLLKYAISMTQMEIAYMNAFHVVDLA